MSRSSYATIPDAFSVSQITGRIAGCLRADEVLADCVVRGELSNYRKYRSGHHYFTLKDADAELKCVMFRGDADRLRFDPEDGLAVVVRGRVDIYEQRGEVQLYVRAMKHDGLGTLYEAFERLRLRLESEGLFAAERKRPLPRYPCCVAVLTSPSGAAIRDMCRILRQRWPSVRIRCCACVVQGAEAAPSLVRALELVNRCDDVDLILIGRGGGSIEDLWAFNEETVARAIVASRIPVISAVGHESDFTIADFVADARAATPSHAAEMAVPELAAVERHFGQLEGRLAGSLTRRLEQARQWLEAIGQRRVLREPMTMFQPHAQRLDELSDRLERSLVTQVRTAGDRLRGLSQTLAALDPTAVLQRGYAILSRESDGKVVTSPDELPAGEAAVARVAAGRLRVRAEVAPQ